MEYTLLKKIEKGFEGDRVTLWDNITKYIEEEYNKLTENWKDLKDTDFMFLRDWDLENIWYYGTDQEFYHFLQDTYKDIQEEDDEEIDLDLMNDEHALKKYFGGWYKITQKEFFYRCKAKVMGKVKSILTEHQYDEYV